jgi:hypothetical protein
MRFRAFWLPNFLFDGVRCKGGGEVDVEGCGRLSVHDRFCMRKLGYSLAGNICQFGGW